jgi:hypothetical protein
LAGNARQVHSAWRELEADGTIKPGQSNLNLFFFREAGALGVAGAGGGWDDGRRPAAVFNPGTFRFESWIEFCAFWQVHSAWRELEGDGTMAGDLQLLLKPGGGQPTQVRRCPLYHVLSSSSSSSSSLSSSSSSYSLVDHQHNLSQPRRQTSGAALLMSMTRSAPCPILRLCVDSSELTLGRLALR